MSDTGLSITADKSSELSKRRTRILGFDLLRFLAVAAVIWFHTHAPGSEYTLWHVPTLVIISAVLACESCKNLYGPGFIRKRASRILLPWLFWCAVFGGIDLVRYFATGRSILMERSGMFLLAGTALHLWFLPFIFVVTVFAAYLRGFVIRDSQTMRITFVALLFLASILLLFWVEKSLFWRSYPVPFIQWAAAAPAVCLGVLLGVAIPSDLRILGGERGVSLLFGIAGGLTLLIATGFTGMAFYSLVACGLVLLANVWRGTESPKWLAFVGSITMGVYLVHPLLIMGVGICLTPIYEDGVLHASLAIVLSVLVACLLVVSPLRSVV